MHKTYGIQGKTVRNVPSKRVAILQSNYIPWRGYFDIIGLVDEFIIYDDTQFTKNDWRNRNRIKTREGIQWLTVPVGIDIKRKIYEVEITDTRWQPRHWETLHHNYRKSSFYKEISSIIAPMYLEMNHTKLSALNLEMIKKICEFLEIETKITDSRDYKTEDGKTNRLVDLCKQSSADIYLSGPSAKNYIDEEKFRKNDISIHWMDYSEYSNYQQLWGNFEPQVSILDLLFNTGKSARNYMKFSKNKSCKHSYWR